MMADVEDFDDEDAYWDAVIARQGLCGKCFAVWDEHEDRVDDNGRDITVCPV